MTSHRPRLTPEQKAILDLITARLSITDPERVAELESAAAEILDPPPPPPRIPRRPRPKLASES